MKINRTTLLVIALAYLQGAASLDMVLTGIGAGFVMIVTLLSGTYLVRTYPKAPPPATLQGNTDIR